MYHAEVLDELLSHSPLGLSAASVLEWSSKDREHLNLVLNIPNPFLLIFSPVRCCFFWLKQQRGWCKALPT